jgi:hypothetical protein
MQNRNEWEKEARLKKDSMAYFPLMVFVTFLSLAAFVAFAYWFFNKIWGG